MTTKLNLEAGPELDTAIATKIVGLKLVKGIWAYWRNPGCWERFSYHAHQHYQNVPEKDLPLVYELGPDQPSPHPPSYSLDLLTAFKLVEFMRNDGFSFKLWQPSGGMGHYATVSFICGNGPCEKHGNPHHNHHGAYDVEAETVPLAIARAAVLAKLCKVREEFRVSPE